MGCCGSGGYVCGVPPKWSAWIYYIGFLLVSVLSWVLRDYGGSALDFGPASGCSNVTSTDLSTNTTNYSSCGELAVLRLSFGSLLFFALMLILTLGITSSENPRVVLHSGLWPIKFLVWGGVIASTFAMPNGVFEVYQQIARVLSAFFILLQLVILLDFIYRINEYLLERDNLAVVLIGLTCVLIAGSIVGMGFLYKYWAPNAGCSLNIFFITWTFVLFLVYGAISVSPLRVESAGLMTSAAVFGYCMYYTWSALNSEPLGECTPTGSGGSQAIRIIAFIVALVAVGFSTTNSGKSSAAFTLSESEAAQDEDLAYRPDFFHFTFFLASAYMAMVLIGWGIGVEEQGEFAFDKGWGSVWAKVAASWICALMYTWSLVAHRVLEGREF